MSYSTIELVSVIGAVFQAVGGILCIIAMLDFDWKAMRDNRMSFQIQAPWHAPFRSSRGPRFMRAGFPILLVGAITVLIRLWTT